MATLDIVTVEQVLANVRIPDGEASLLPSWITAVSLYIDDLCGPVVQRTITAETCHGGSSVIALAKRPVVSVTTITENAVTLAATDYHVIPDSGLVQRLTSGYLLQNWTTGSWNVAVTYVAGRYATTATVDPLFQTATIMAVKAMWTSQKSIAGTQAFGAYGGDFEVNADTPGTGQYTLPTLAYMLLSGANHIQRKVAFA